MIIHTYMYCTIHSIFSHYLNMCTVFPRIDPADTISFNCLRSAGTIWMRPNDRFFLTGAAMRYYINGHAHVLHVFCWLHDGYYLRGRILFEGVDTIWGGGYYLSADSIICTWYRPRGTIQWRILFECGLYYLYLISTPGYYSMADTIRVRTLLFVLDIDPGVLFNGGYYSSADSIIWLDIDPGILFNGGYYLTCRVYSKPKYGTSTCTCIINQWF